MRREDTLTKSHRFMSIPTPKSGNVMILIIGMKLPVIPMR